MLLAALMLPPQVARVQEDPAQTLQRLINAARLAEGTSPLAASKLLTQAAQRHAEDMSASKKIDHQGSDNSTYQQRIRDTGYRAWNDGLLVNESIWAGLGTAENAFSWFRENPEHWDMFLDHRYREVGIGYAEDSQGVHYFVLVFGVRPGVLPIFINDGAATTDSPQVAVRLTDEEAIPLGDSNWMGKAIEVRFSNTPEFDDTPWQPWESLVPWVLPDTAPGDYAVYVEFRDGAGRTTISEDTIRLVNPGEATDETPATEATLAPPSPPITDIAQPTLPASAPETAALDLPPSAGTTEVPSTAAPAAPTPHPDAAAWTPASSTLPPSDPKPVDWPLVAIFVLQGIVFLLGVTLFLRRK